MGTTQNKGKNVKANDETMSHLDTFEVSGETLALMAAGRLGDAAEDRDDLDVALICAARELKRARERLSGLRALIPYLSHLRRALAVGRALAVADNGSTAVAHDLGFLREMLALLAEPAGGGS